MTMLVVHALTDSAASHGSASTATVLGLFGAQACARHGMALRMACTRHARRTVHGTQMALLTIVPWRYSLWQMLTVAILTMADAYYGSTHYGRCLLWLYSLWQMLTMALLTIADGALGRGRSAARPRHTRLRPLHALRRADRAGRAGRAAGGGRRAAGRLQDDQRGGRGAAGHSAAHLALARRQARPRRRGVVRRAAARLRGLPGEEHCQTNPNPNPTPNFNPSPSSSPSHNPDPSPNPSPSPSPSPTPCRRSTGRRPPSAAAGTSRSSSRWWPASRLSTSPRPARTSYSSSMSPPRPSSSRSSRWPVPRPPSPSPQRACNLTHPGLQPHAHRAAPPRPLQAPASSWAAWRPTCRSPPSSSPCASEAYCSARTWGGA